MEKELHGINYIELDEENIGNLIQELETPCFGYDKKLIIVKNSNLFKKETKKKTSGTKELREKLEKYLKDNIEDINERIVLVFIEESVEKLNITKTIEALGGIICEFELQKPMALEKRLIAICNAYKVKAEPGAINFLIETSGISMQELINEIRKLIEYVRSRWNYNKKRCRSLSNKDIRQ